jgi:hypothetical protein
VQTLFLTFAFPVGQNFAINWIELDTGGSQPPTVTPPPTAPPTAPTGSILYDFTTGNQHGFNMFGPCVQWAGQAWQLTRIGSCYGFMSGIQKNLSSNASKITVNYTVSGVDPTRLTIFSIPGSTSSWSFSQLGTQSRTVEGNASQEIKISALATIGTASDIGLFINWIRIDPIGGVSTTTPTATPIPQTFHVNCSLGFANVRNFPAGQTIPTPQIDGRVVYVLSPGTVVNVYEFRPARDGILWARITNYEWNTRDTLWIRTKQPDNVTDILVAGNPSCSASTPNFTQPTTTPLPPSYPAGTPGCAPGNSCPHISPTISDIDLVSFILACEAGAPVSNPSLESIDDAIANAHVVYNRMDSGLYRGTARQVVSQSGQWQPFSEGCNASLGLSNPAQIAQQIRLAAQDLVNGVEPRASLGLFNASIDYLGLYTFGVPNPNHTATPPAVATMLAPYCPGGTTTAMSVYVDIASFGGGVRANASVFFSDSPGCVLP